MINKPKLSLLLAPTNIEPSIFYSKEKKSIPHLKTRIASTSLSLRYVTYIYHKVHINNAQSPTYCEFLWSYLDL